MMVISPVDTIDLIPSPTVVSPEDPIPNSKPKMQSPLILKNLSYHGKEIKWDKTTKQWTVYYNCSCFGRDDCRAKLHVTQTAEGQKFKVVSKHVCRQLGHDNKWFCVMEL